MKILVLASGRGTNFEKIHSRQMELEQDGGKNYGAIEHVFSNDPAAPVLAKAKALKIETSSISSEKFFADIGKPPSDESGRILYDSAVIPLLKGFRARSRGAGRIQEKAQPSVHRKIRKQDLKPLPRGHDQGLPRKRKKRVRPGIRKRRKTIRCTVYLENDPETRFGTVIAQSADISLEGFGIGDGAEMEEKIREQGEWKLFPFVVHDLIANGRVAIDEKNSIYVDGQRAGERGFSLSP